MGRLVFEIQSETLLSEEVNHPVQSFIFPFQATDFEKWSLNPPSEGFKVTFPTEPSADSVCLPVNASSFSWY